MRLTLYKKFLASIAAIYLLVQVIGLIGPPFLVAGIAENPEHSMRHNYQEAASVYFSKIAEVSGLRRSAVELTWWLTLGITVFLLILSIVTVFRPAQIFGALVTALTVALAAAIATLESIGITFVFYIVAGILVVVMISVHVYSLVRPYSRSDMHG